MQKRFPFCGRAHVPVCEMLRVFTTQIPILLWLRIPRHGIITSKLPLARLRVCKAHVPVLTHRALRTLSHAKPQHVRFCWNRFAASCYNNPKTAAAAAGRTLCAYALLRVVLGTLQHAKPQYVRFCWGRFAASCYNNPKTAAAAAGHTLCAYALPRVVLGTLQHAKPQYVRFCWGRFAAPWYNNLKPAACEAARVRCTRPCAGAQGFENKEGTGK